MRIISIRIRNLNSLLGDWTIRLDTPEYTSTGIFAITGPTGAGKSTILDAICLALYGSTPRLDKVTKTSNEIMSRQASDCLAEVRFRTSRGEYLCTWSQKRTGKKSASASLQPPKHKLYDAGGAALADSTKAVLAAVTELTGMDFPRFTQSMMLAQGHFASFLLADGDKRAPLLEKITGTTIYSEISRNVHERTREEMDKFKTIEAERAAQHLLTEEKEEELRGTFKEISEKTHLLTLKEQNLQESMERLKAAEEIERESAALAEEKQHLLQDQSSFLSDEKKLDDAERAVLPSERIAAIHSRRKELQADAGRLSSLRKQIEKMEATEHKERLALKTAADELEGAVSTVQKKRELWNIVRKKDADIEACKRSADEKKQALNQRFHEREQGKEARKKALHKKRMAQETLSALYKEKECHAEDEYLLESLASMENSMDLLEKENITFESLHGSITQASLHLEKQECSLKKSREEEKKLSHAMADIKESREKSLASLKELSGGSSFTGLLQKRDALTERVHILENAMKNALERNRQLERSAQFLQKAHALEASVKQEEQELHASRIILKTMQEAQSLKEKILSYEEERLRLTDGSPCPLCGSIHHPFAQKAPLLLKEEKQKLTEQEKSITSMEAALMENKGALQYAKSMTKETASSAEKSKHALLEALSELSPLLASTLLPCPSQAEEYDVPPLISPIPSAWEKEIIASLTLSEKAPGLYEALQRFFTETIDELEKTRQILHRMEDVDNAIRTASKHFEQLSSKHEGMLLSMKDTEREILRLETQISSFKKNLAESSKKKDALCSELRKKIQSFGEDGLSIGDLKKALSSLTARKHRFSSLLQQEKSAQEALTECTHVLAENTSLLIAAQKEWMEARRQCMQKKQELTELEHRRQELFGSRSVEEEEKHSQETINHMELSLKETREAHQRASHALTQMRSETAALSEQLRKTEESLSIMEHELHEHLSAARFSSEEECLAALLPLEERKILREKKRSLEQRSAGIEAREKVLQQKQQAQILPLPPRRETELLLEKTKEERENLVRNAGILQEKLRANEEKKEQDSLLLRRQNAQAAVCRKWSALNELIGSSDGKKFRNYAQELTFRRLIHMANRQLSFMTDRYLLVHSKEEALTLNVIDRYQADAVRSSRNLSGGESFLVSLSLALGLAQMAGKNVSVDSVFLDEGFGSLDEESLGTALDMLSSLRSKGKMIGIISHIQAVRDRIPLQIEVLPKGGGRSSLSGIGVSHTESHRP